MPRGAIALLLFAAVAGCASFWLGHAPPEPPPGIVYSPNGEPLSGGPLGPRKCEDAMGRWFDRVDTSHSGSIDRAEFLADADRQFTVMDLNKDGVLTPAVLAQYRAPYLVDLPRRARNDQDDSDSASGNRRERRSGDEIPISMDRADPVMLADAGLRNQVTRDQFLAYAAANFATLDRGRAGRISRDAAIAAFCK